VKRIVLIDDHTLFRAGIKALLTSQEDFEVVAEASTASEGYKAVVSHACDVAVIDYVLPDQDGPELVAQIKLHTPKLPILLLSAHTEVDKVRLVMDRGCHGYIVKSATENELLVALRIVAAGGIYVHPAVAPALLSGATEEKALTSRQIAIIRYLTAGKSNQEIADDLHLSLGTIKRNLSQLFEQLEVSDRTQLLSEAIARGLVKPS
jgi:DNA-binding NarL/FixJ family response regulator